MPYDSLPSQMANIRLGEVPRYTRRVLGMPYLRPEDFIFEVPRDEASRIRDIARHARGEGPAPIIVLGVMPRSGTNFVRDLLALDPSVCADPGRLYEFPLLHSASDNTAFTQRFLSYFPRNAEVVGRYDMLARQAGAWLRDLQREAGDCRILLKCPHVQNLSLAPLIFPDCNIVICVRDGRDVIESTRRTFRSRRITRKSFSQLAHEWGLATEAAYTAMETYSGITLARYEDLVGAPREAAEALVRDVGLDVRSFPFDQIETLPVRGSSRSRRTNESRWQPEQKTADFKPVGRWSGWSRRQLRSFDRVAGDTLRRAGYFEGAAG